MSFGRQETQTDLVNKSLLVDPSVGVFTEKFTPPGIQTLHTLPREQIVETMLNVLKARSNVIAFTFVVGSHFEVTYRR